MRKRAIEADVHECTRADEIRRLKEKLPGLLNSRATNVAGAALASPVVERPAISVQIAVQEEIAVAAQVEDPVTGLPGRGDLLGGVRFAGVPFGRGAGGQDRRVFGGEGIGQAS